jgi:polar amino acid transport system substrate-binding protein
MQVKQAVGTTRNRAPWTLEFLRSLIEELKADGFVADAIRRADNPDVSVAPPG